MFPNTQIMMLTDANFQAKVLNAQKLVLVDCWASWCGAVHQVNPAYHELAIAYPQPIKIGCLNIALFDQLGTHYRIRVVPTLLIFQNGQVVDRVMGTISYPDLTHKLNALLSGIPTVRSRVACS
jgi:thioredoxin 1